MVKGFILITVLGVLVAILPLGASGGGTAIEGCQTDCASCHSLSKDEAIGLLQDSSMAPADARIDEISLLESVGLWKVTLDMPDEKPLYIDFGKKNVFIGEFYPLRQPLFEDTSSSDLINGE